MWHEILALEASFCFFVRLAFKAPNQGAYKCAVHLISILNAGSTNAATPTKVCVTSGRCPYAEALAAKIS